jgi:hypothetical protein
MRCNWLTVSVEDQEPGACCSLIYRANERLSQTWHYVKLAGFDRCQQTKKQWQASGK